MSFEKSTEKNHSLAPQCPGCHFGCTVDAYRCARGKGFHALWMQGKPVPERGVPPMLRKGANSKPGEREKHAPSPEARIMHGFNIISHVLESQPVEAPERKVLFATGLQGGFFARELVGERAFVQGSLLDDAISALLNDGLVAQEEEEVAGTVLLITDEGKERLAEWNAERTVFVEEFFGPLSEDEREQLTNTLFKLIGAQIERERKR